jgi:4a-hydroxytetrahydrobiopterin dehydratase
MSDLTQFKCVPCRGGEPTVTEAEMAEFLPQVPDWQIVERDSIQRLERVFRYPLSGHRVISELGFCVFYAGCIQDIV